MKKFTTELFMKKIDQIFFLSFSVVHAARWQEGVSACTNNFLRDL